MEMLRPLESMADLLPAVYGHHERFEGVRIPNGCPSSTLGELARLTCIADSYDAMTSHRAYRRALTHQRALGNSGVGLVVNLTPILPESSSQRSVYSDGWLFAGCNNQ